LRGRKLSRSIAYIASREGNNQDSFIKLLQGIGCDIKQKDVVERSGSMKCNWDVEIVIDALAMAPKIDVFVLASGDGDFTYLLKALNAKGVKTEVVAFKANTANSLMDEADEYRDIYHDVLIENRQAWRNREERVEEEEEEKEKEEDYYEPPKYDE
jgi:uncharacterized LabA/DUF88 family protein